MTHDGPGTADNDCCLAGVVIRGPETRTSPAGVPIARFTLEHRSQRREAGLPREVRARIVVVAGGAGLQGVVAKLAAGRAVRVRGFLARGGHRAPDLRLELHALHIDCLD